MSDLLIVNASSAVGDDQLGDGSRELPVRTIARAKEISDLLGGVPISYDGMLGTLIPETEQVEPSWRDGDRRGVGILLAIVSAALVLGPLAWHNPMLAGFLLLIGLVAALFLCPDPTPRRQAEDEQVREFWAQQW